MERKRVRANQRFREIPRQIERNNSTSPEHLVASTSQSACLLSFWGLTAGNALERPGNANFKVGRSFRNQKMVSHRVHREHRESTERAQREHRETPWERQLLSWQVLKKVFHRGDRENKEPMPH